MEGGFRAGFGAGAPRGSCMIPMTVDPLGKCVVSIYIVTTYNVVLSPRGSYFRVNPLECGKAEVGDFRWQRKKRTRGHDGGKPIRTQDNGRSPNISGRLGIATPDGFPRRLLSPPFYRTARPSRPSTDRPRERRHFLSGRTGRGRKEGRS